MDSFWLQGMLCGFKAAYDCIKAFSEIDFTEDLKKIDVPTLIIHGDDDQIVPRSEEHTSELQSLRHVVCRLLLEKKKNNTVGNALSKHSERSRTPSPPTEVR